MDPITLVTAAITMLTPYLIKSGEKIAEEMGSSLWTWLKSKFTDKNTIIDNPTDIDKNKLQMQLMTLMTQDTKFAQELEEIMNRIKQEHNDDSSHAMVVNQGTVEKQVNMTVNNGTINL